MTTCKGQRVRSVTLRHVMLAVKKSQLHPQGAVIAGDISVMP